MFLWPLNLQAYDWSRSKDAHCVILNGVRWFKIYDKLTGEGQNVLFIPSRILLSNIDVDDGKCAEEPDTYLPQKRPAPTAQLEKETKPRKICIVMWSWNVDI